jgi:hypothetical protein
VASEWSSLDPSYKDEPVLGVFTSNAHHNLGNSASWRDVYLFLLRAVEITREMLKIEEGSLTHGETWAVMRIMQWLNQHPDGEATDPQRAAYRSALSRNDRQIAELMKSTWDDLSRDDVGMAEFVKRVDTIRKETDDLRRQR